MPKLSQGIFRCFSYNLYHFFTVNVRTRIEINIPHINFVKVNVNLGWNYGKITKNILREFGLHTAE